MKKHVKIFAEKIKSGHTIDEALESASNSIELNLEKWQTAHENFVIVEDEFMMDFDHNVVYYKVIAEETVSFDNPVWSESTAKPPVVKCPY